MTIALDRLVTRELLLREVWNIDFDSETSVLDTYISYLRAKIDSDEPVKLIQTLRGVGYTMRAIKR